MLNQDQYNASMLEQPVHGGFTGVAKATLPMPAAPVAPNDTDVDKSIEQLKNNDSSLTELNLNNIKVRVTISRTKLKSTIGGFLSFIISVEPDLAATV